MKVLHSDINDKAFNIRPTVNLIAKTIVFCQISFSFLWFSSDTMILKQIPENIQTAHILSHS